VVQACCMLQVIYIAWPSLSEQTPLGYSKNMYEHNKYIHLCDIILNSCFEQAIPSPQRNLYFLRLSVYIMSQHSLQGSWQTNFSSCAVFSVCGRLKEKQICTNGTTMGDVGSFRFIENLISLLLLLLLFSRVFSYEGWNFNSGNYLFTSDTK